jgi:hypothetical protein
MRIYRVERFECGTRVSKDEVAEISLRRAAEVWCLKHAKTVGPQEIVVTNVMVPAKSAVFRVSKRLVADVVTVSGVDVD